VIGEYRQVSVGVNRDVGTHSLRWGVIQGEPQETRSVVLLGQEERFAKQLFEVLRPGVH